jgi:hypothetical protein
MFIDAKTEYSENSVTVFTYVNKLYTDVHDCIHARKHTHTNIYVYSSSLLIIWADVMVMAFSKLDISWNNRLDSPSMVNSIRFNLTN